MSRMTRLDPARRLLSEDRAAWSFIAVGRFAGLLLGVPCRAMDPDFAFGYSEGYSQALHPSPAIRAALGAIALYPSVKTPRMEGLPVYISPTLMLQAAHLLEEISTLELTLANSEDARTRARAAAEQLQQKIEPDGDWTALREALDKRSRIEDTCMELEKQRTALYGEGVDLCLRLLPEVPKEAQVPV